MIFYLIHQIIQNLIPWNKETKDSKKNITTFIIGSLLYVFLFSFVNSTNYQGFIESNFILFTIKHWFFWILFLDISAMAVIYKCYYNRSILDELPETWGEKRKMTDASALDAQVAETFIQKEEQAIAEEAQVNTDDGETYSVHESMAGSVDEDEAPVTSAGDKSEK